MFGLEVNRDSAVPITSQLIRQIRDAILGGKIGAKAKMPPSRTLADELGVSRNTIILVYEQLIAEGYLESVTGSGTFVAELGVLPEIKKHAAGLAHEQDSEHSEGTIAFYAGNPDISAFPRALWAKALKDACLDAEDSAFGYGGAKGHTGLRQALADYLYRAKGIFCGSERIFIVPGTAPGIEIISHLVCGEGSCAAMEDPCLTFTRNAINRSGVRIIPVESDCHGMRTDLLPEDEDVKLIYAAPSHQYPLGGVLPIARRIALLDYAQRHDAYIIEDDYDSEFRYQGEPIQSLWSLGDERVIYLGSFSNVFSPSLRMAYIIVPQHLTKKLNDMLAQLNVWAGVIEQIALARLIESKQFDRHIYRMKRLYDSKRKILIKSLACAFGSSIKISGELAGLHMLVSFENDITEEVKRAISGEGVAVDYAEGYAVIKGRHKNSLVMGFGDLDRERIEEGVKRLKKSFEKYRD